MNLFLAYLHIIIFLSLATTSLATIKYAKTGCNDMCGNVTIPYPFGIGVGCSVNEWYTIDCNSSTPYLSALNHLEVLGVNLIDQTVPVSMPRISDCQNHVQNSSQTMSIDLGTSPFMFSRSRNRFVFEGCGNAIMKATGTGFPITGCSTSCQNDIIGEINDCFGISCCQATIPYHLKSYTMNVKGSVGDGACESAFLVDFSVQTIVGGKAFDPVSLVWTLTHQDMIECCSAAHRINLELNMGDDISMETQTLKCSLDTSFNGNPYLNDGCEVREECAKCLSSSCNYDIIYDEDGSSRLTNFICEPFNGTRSFVRRSSLYAIIVVSICMGAVFLVTTTYALCKLIKKTKEIRQRKRFFKRNGGLLLKQQEEADPSLIGKTILFTSLELKNATNNFNENRVLGRGGQGTVYKGMLVDGRIVAIKKSKVVDESQLEQFINEVVILSQISHRNVVKLLGCCLETEVPLLVSEFIPNGTLYDHLHRETIEFPISFKMRLQIATEVAGALAYLHSATSIPIYHRDIKTTNILLDNKYRAKVSDFGTSRFVSIDKTHLTTLVRGTIGYLDPEYFQSSQFTEESDVYSFGVVLVELLTEEKPISETRFGENRSLATHFMLAMEEGRVMSIFDVVVIEEGSSDELMLLANLAARCLNLNGKYRPTMKEVAIELETIRTSHIPAMIQTNTEHVIYGEEVLMLPYSKRIVDFQ